MLQSAVFNFEPICSAIVLRFKVSVAQEKSDDNVALLLRKLKTGFLFSNFFRVHVGCLSTLAVAGKIGLYLSPIILVIRHVVSEGFRELQ